MYPCVCHSSLKQICRFSLFRNNYKQASLHTKPSKCSKWFYDDKHLVTEMYSHPFSTFSRLYLCIIIYHGCLTLFVQLCMCDILSSRCRCYSFMCLWSRGHSGNYIADGQITVCVTKKGHVSVCAPTSDSKL